MNRKLIICSSSLLNVRRLTASRMLCCSYRNIFMLIRKCGSVFRLCFALYHFHYDFSFSFLFLLLFFFPRVLLSSNSLLSCFAYTIFSVCAPLAWWAYTHIIFCYTMNSEEHQMDSNTNVLPQLPSSTTAAATTTIKNEISAFFSSDVYQRKNVLRV